MRKLGIAVVVATALCIATQVIAAQADSQGGSSGGPKVSGGKPYTGERSSQSGTGSVKVPQVPNVVRPTHLGESKPSNRAAVSDNNRNEHQ